MSQGNQKPTIVIGFGDRRVVPSGFHAQVIKGGTAIINEGATAQFLSGSSGYVLKGANVIAHKGSDIYLQVNTTYLAQMDWFSVKNGLGIQDPRNFTTCTLTFGIAKVEMEDCSKAIRMARVSRSSGPKVVRSTNANRQARSAGTAMVENSTAARFHAWRKTFFQ